MDCAIFFKYEGHFRKLYKASRKSVSRELKNYRKWVSSAIHLSSLKKSVENSLWFVENDFLQFEKELGKTVKNELIV